MRKLLKKLLKWILHDHDFGFDYRIVTYYEILKNKKWVKDNWLEIEWHQTCKSCGKKIITRFKSELKIPK